MGSIVERKFVGSIMRKSEEIVSKSNAGKRRFEKIMNKPIGLGMENNSNTGKREWFLSFKIIWS